MSVTSLVTGGAGFIGSHLAEQLAGLGHRVVVADDLSGGFRENIPNGAVFDHINLVDGDVDNLFRTWQPDYVWHLAAYAAEGLSHWVRAHNVKNNWLASTRLINAALKYKVERFTFTSSMAVYGSQPPPFVETMRPAPEDPYGIAKFAVEQDLRTAGEVFDFPYVIFRPHNVYGPRQNIGDPYRNVVGIFMRQAIEGDPLTVFGDGTQTRAFSHIADIVGPMVRSLSVDCVGETFNIGGEEIVTIGELAERVRGLFPGAAVEHMPERYEVKHAHCDHTKAREMLGFSPSVSFDVGLAGMADWARSVGVKRSSTPELELVRGLPVFWQKRVEESVV